MSPVSRSVIRAILGGALLVPLFGVPSPATAASFTHRAVITIDRNQVPGVAGLVDFPVLVSATSTNLRTTANGGFVTSSNAATTSSSRARTRRRAPRPRHRAALTTRSRATTG